MICIPQEMCFSQNSIKKPTSDISFKHVTMLTILALFAPLFRHIGSLPALACCSLCTIIITILLVFSSTLLRSFSLRLIVPRLHRWTCSVSISSAIILFSVFSSVSRPIASSTSSSCSHREYLSPFQFPNSYTPLDYGTKTKIQNSKYHFRTFNHLRCHSNIFTEVFDYFRLYLNFLFPPYRLT